MLMRLALFKPFVSSIVAAQYWKLLANDISWVDPYGSSPYFQAIKEFQFFNSTDATGTNLCIGKTATASEYGSFLPSNANDNNFSTYWQSNGASGSSTVHWWSVNLESSTAIKSLTIYPFGETNGFHSKSYKVQYSSDNSTWSDLTIINTTQNGTPQTFINLQ